MLERQRELAQGEPLRERSGVATRVGRSKEVNLSSCHERGPHERIRTSFLIITIDEDDSRPHSKQGATRILGMPREMRRMSSEFDRGAQERSGKRIGREDQDVVTAHVAIECEVSILAGDEWKA